MNITKRYSKLFLNNIGLIVIILIGVLLRLTILLANKSFSFDETYAFWNATNFGGIISLISGNYYDFPAHSFLLYVFIQLMSQISSSSIWLRLLPFFFSIITLPVIYLIGKITFGKRTGIVLLIFFTFSFYFVYFSSVLKVYSQLMFCQSVFLLLFIRQYIYGEKNKLIYLIFGIVSFATDYSFIWLFLSLTAFIIISRFTARQIPKKFSSGRKINEKKILLVHFLIILCGLPWIPKYLNKLQEYKGLEWLSPLSLSDIANGFMRYFGLNYSILNNYIFQIPFLIFVAIIILLVVFKIVISPRYRCRLLFLLILLIPYTIIILINCFVPFYADYHLMIVTISLFIFLSLVLQYWSKAGMILLVMFLIINLYSFDNFLREEPFQDWQALSNYITLAYPNQEVVLYMYPLVFRSPLNYYQKLMGKSNNKPVIFYALGVPAFSPKVKNICIINRTYGNSTVEKLAQSAKKQLNEKYLANGHKLFGKIELSCYTK